VAAKPHRPENAFSALRTVFTPSIFNNRRRAVAVFSNEPDSRAGGIRCVADAACVGHRVPDGSRAFARYSAKSSVGISPKAEPASMLPGFRFLFAAIVLSMSILVFGLGAAALLRAAHEEFASTPPWRAAPETVFAQPVEATPPVLALARVDAPVTDKASEKAPDNAPADATSAAITSAPAEPERTAALKPEDSPPPETVKPEPPVAESPVAESPAQNDTTSAPADVPASVAETKILDTNIADTKTADTKPADTKIADTNIVDTKIAMPEEASLPANQTEPPAASESAGTQVAPDANIAAMKIATLGGPPVTIKTPLPVKGDSAEPDPSVIKKRQQAQRAAKRRRTAARARVTAQMPQQPVNSFGQPAPTIVRSR
jgi:hypothetical protein